MNSQAIALTLVPVILLVNSTRGDERKNETLTRRVTPPPESKKPRELSKKFTHPITFRFVDEHDRPIQGDFTLHQYKGGEYFENWHRYLPLNEKGEITIKEFPPEFEFGGTSKDEFYHYWLQSTDVDPSQGEFLYRCPPSGAMKFEITAFPKKHYHSLVVEYHRKSKDGSHRIVKGIGVFPDDAEHVIGGLEPGEYFIAIKFEYEDSKPIYKSEGFEIGKKKYVTLPKIEITDAAIESSKR